MIRELHKEVVGVVEGNESMIDITIGGDVEVVGLGVVEEEAESLV